MSAVALSQHMKERGIRLFAGVPDSTLRPLFDVIVRDPELRYVPAVREDVALGIASAAYFTGGMGAVLMQNSGLGNVVNPLTSFSLLYRVPVLMVVGWRGHGDPQSDAPEHRIMGKKTAGLLDVLKVPYEVLGENDPGGVVDRALERARSCSVPAALLVPPGGLA